MSPDTRKTAIAAWQARKQEESMHPFLQEETEIGLIPFGKECCWHAISGAS